MRLAARRSSNDAALGAALCALLILVAPAGAEPSGPQPAPDAPDLTARREALRGMEDSLSAADENKKKLEGQISTLREDRERLNQTLLDATQRLQETEQRAVDIESGLVDLKAKEEALVHSLMSRRALIGEVLAVLQRMGRRAPPALLAQPQDILEAVRASLALGAVIPQMRQETVTLQGDLTELVRLRDSQRREQGRLARKKDDLKSQRENLEQMIASRQEALADAQGALGAEAQRMRSLAERATSLKDLLARMEAESAAARRAAELARQADLAREAADAALSREQRSKALAAPFKDPARLAPAVAFIDLKGHLPLPAAGPVVRRFGASDGFGGTEKGLSIGAPVKGIVASPCDGWVSFSGPYRTYGQLLIINAGGGYYVVLAGMSRINVSVGQFVLAGEPVAIMGDGAAQSAATIAIGAKQPILYVEFRKDGASIDSSPWWAKSDSRKVGG